MDADLALVDGLVRGEVTTSAATIMMKPRSNLQTNVAMDDDPAAFRLALAAANGFDEGDLKENRSGRIARGQYGRLLLEAFRPAVFSGVVLLGWFVFLFFRDLLLPDVVLSLVKRAWPFFMVITAATVGAFLLGLARSTRLGAQVLLDLKDGEVETVSGKVSTYRCSSAEYGVSALFASKAEHHFYWIGDLKLEVSPSGYELLVKRYDQQYCPPMRVYYSPRSRLLLSAEPVLVVRAPQQPSIWLKPAS